MNKPPQETTVDRGSLRVSVGGRETTAPPGLTLTIGRDSRSLVHVFDERVSRQHAVIRWEHECWIFEDVGSTNGSYVGNDRVKRLAVRSDLSIRLGDPRDGPLIQLSLREAYPGESSGLGDKTGRHAALATTRIGRAAANNIVVSDLTVSRHHAELRTLGNGQLELADLGSANGTFLNGSKTSRAVVSVGDVITVGAHSFRVLVDHSLEEYVDKGSVDFAAYDLVARTGDGHVLLDRVSFALQPRCLLAVVGPTGAGKSTLMHALTGLKPASEGRVLYAGRDLYTNYEAIRQRIGYVPQDDILHVQLTVRRALGYAAELRFAPDAARAHRDSRVNEVIRQLGLGDRADMQIRKLSGGQRKRTSVGVELLTQPSLLFLDEPTSGLDPGYERALMGLFRSLAEDGRTVIVVTHSVQSLDLCHRVLFLAPGGRLAYFGPPAGALGYFGRRDYAEVFADLERERDTDWRGKYLRSALYARYVPAATLHSEPPKTQAPVPSKPWGHCASTLLRRYAAVLLADRRNLVLLALQAPILGLLILLTVPESGFAEAVSVPNLVARKVVLALVLSATWLGGSNAIREIVKERAILRREAAVGVPLSAYVASKGVALAIITAIQAFALVTLATAHLHGPPQSAVLAHPMTELVIDVALTGFASVAFALLISAAVANADMALSALPIVLIAQLVLSGALFQLSDKPGLREASYVATARWGFSATASTVNLIRLEMLPCQESASSCPAEWRQDRTAWQLSAGNLLVLSTAALFTTWMVLRRYSPSER